MAKKTGITIIEGESRIPANPIFVNRFKVQHEGNFVVLFLAFHCAGQTLTNLVVTVPKMMVQVLKNQMLSYQDDVKQKVTDCIVDKEAEITAVNPQTFHGDHWGFAHVGGVAEVRLQFFSMQKLVEAQETGKVQTSPVLYIHMPLSVQLGIINSLYFR